MRVLAVSDEVDDRLWTSDVRLLVPDLVVGCGDVAFELLGRIAEATGAPVVFVPGNHDPDVSGYRPTRAGLVVKSGFVTTPPWPPGTLNADCRIVDIGGVRIAGLGGCLRYREGPNQYTEAEQRRRGRRLARRARWGLRNRGPVDVVLAHAAPRGVGDGDDPAHVGFAALHHLVGALRPRLLLHGHVNPMPGGGEHWIGPTRVVNVFGHRLLHLDGASACAPSRPDPSGPHAGERRR